MKATTMRNKYPTIGLLVDWAGNTFGIKMWEGVVEYAKENNANVICFVGGAINTPYKYERQRNTLFKLINNDNVDGLIVLTSLIDHFIDNDELNNFFSSFRSLPVISIGHQLKKIPSFIIDNKPGMRELLCHLINVDGYRRIAFICGPENKGDAVERYNVYREILDKSGIEFDPSLVVPGNYDMVSGRAAIEKLLDERETPFEAVVAANDSMALGAMIALRERGISVPEQVAVTGYDDIEIDMTVSPALTTVRQPLYNVGRKAAEALLMMMNNETVPELEVFNTELIIRESCGCFSSHSSSAGLNVEKRVDDYFFGNAGEDAFMKQKGSIFKEMEKTLAPYLSDYDDYNRNDFSFKIRNLLNAFYTELFNHKAGTFLAVWNDILWKSIQSGLKIAVLQEVLSALHRCGLPPITKKMIRYQAEFLIQRAREMIADAETKVQEYTRVRTAHETMIVRALGEELFTTVNLQELAEMLERNFPTIGINSCYLSITNQMKSGNDIESIFSKTILAFNENGIVEVGEEGISFPSRQLAPNWLLPRDRTYSMMVESLYQNNGQVAYILLEMNPPKGIVYEMLSRRLRSALKGGLLLRQLHNQAKIVARTNEKMQMEINYRRQAEIALRDSEKRLRTILEANPIPLVIYRETDGKILYTNKYFFITFDLDFSYERDRTIFDFFADPMEPLYLHRLLKKGAAESRESIQNYEVNLKRAGGGNFSGVLSLQRMMFYGEAAIIAGFNDLTERKRLEKEILEISKREQQRIGQDLHDGLGQQLAGIAYVCKVLEGRLKKKGLQEAEIAAEVADHIFQAIGQTKNLAQGLFPVNLEKNGIIFALRDLTDKIEKQYKLPCRFNHGDDISIEDNSVALHLYRIAQEAIHNAVKHGKPREISVNLAVNQNKLALMVADDGVGLPEGLEEKTGMGLSIMQYRSNMINGKLSIEQGKSRGTVVTCLIDNSYLNKGGQ